MLFGSIPVFYGRGEVGLYLLCDFLVPSLLKHPMELDVYHRFWHEAVQMIHFLVRVISRSLVSCCKFANRLVFVGLTACGCHGPHKARL